ncbi:MAG TPA: hypothetical protein VMU88_01005 [bacterium]|nr:hypothetical protein [bacterium]
MKKIQAVLAAVLVVSFVGAALAEDHPMSPKHRLVRQHHRIKQGVKNGSITPQEHKQLAEEGHDINKERRTDLKEDGGKLTPADRKNLEQQENQRSQQIYQDKHN